jgi:hypothetical protein
MAIVASFLRVAGGARGFSHPGELFMLAHKIRPVVVCGPQRNKIRMARFAGIRGRNIIVTGIARCHRRYELAHNRFLSVEVGMARFACNLPFSGVHFVRENELTFRSGQRDISFGVVAGMAIGAIFIQLFLVAGLAISLLAEEEIGRNFAL